jgi:hypothetical protein
MAAAINDKRKNLRRIKKIPPEIIKPFGGLNRMLGTVYRLSSQYLRNGSSVNT